MNESESNDFAGFEFVSEACCGAGKYKGQLLCIPVLKPCENRRVHVFWDAFHPTEATNVFLGRSLFSIVTPIIPNATESSSG
jgi:phospholipase/lecithinase/hemolysin